MITINGKIYRNRKKHQVFIYETCGFFKPKFKTKYGVDLAICPLTKKECEKPVADNPDLCQTRLKEISKK
jgi:hypothetical protein